MDAAEPEIGEAPVDAHRDDGSIERGQLVEGGACNAVRSSGPARCRRVVGANRHTTANGVGVSSGTARTCPSAATTHGSPSRITELAVEVLDGADAEVAVLEQLAHRRVAVEGAGHQRVECARLERGVLDRGIVREAGPRERPDVQRADQSVVDDVAGHARSVRTAAARGSHAVTLPVLGTLNRALRGSACRKGRKEGRAG